MLKIAQGAEAVLYKDHNDVIKERFSKKYRYPHLDESLRKFRTRREAKVLRRLAETNFPAPHLKNFSDERMSIVMDFIPGEKLKDVMGHTFSREIGLRVAELHTTGIIHGDLTTSNMIVHKENRALHFIDFGLSFFSEKTEDKAVDLFLLERTLESTHYELPGLFENVLQGYSENNPNGKEILDRLEEVRKRGRNKKK